MKDSITLITQHVSNVAIPTEWYCNIWIWVSIVALFIILILIKQTASKLRTSTAKNIKAESLSKDVDFNNIIKSSFYATELYNKLKVKCHPDKFTDPILKRKADQLFQEITQNKTNLKRLEELKLEAIEVLNINL